MVIIQGQREEFDDVDRVPETRRPSPRSTARAWSTSWRHWAGSSSESSIRGQKRCRPARKREGAAMKSRRRGLSRLPRACVLPGTSRGQDYPSRPIQLVVPFPPAARSTSRCARGAGSSGADGQSIVIENQPGANGIGAASTRWRGPPGRLHDADTASFALNADMYKDLRYDVDRDFAPITTSCRAPGTSGRVGRQPEQDAAGAGGALEDSQEHGHVRSPGVGNTMHLAGELLGKRRHAEMLHVPYKGRAHSINAVIGGSVQIAIMPPTMGVTFVRSRRLRALAFTGAKRLPELPTCRPWRKRDSPASRSLAAGSAGRAERHAFCPGSAAADGSRESPGGPGGARVHPEGRLQHGRAEPTGVRQVPGRRSRRATGMP